MHSHEGYKLRRFLAPLLLLFYAAFALQAKPAGDREIYPFFNWSLFSRATPFGADVTLRVLSIDGTPMERPQLLYQMAEHLEVARKQDGLAFKIIGQFSQAVARGELERAERLRGVIENRILGDAENIEYELVLIRFDPIARYRTGEIESVKVLGSYAKGAQ